jgi:putative thioredoxin
MQRPQTIVEVGSGDFDQEVLERSREVPVVVDFWAPWCAPCRMLGPMLERLARDAGGAWRLAKVNTDKDPALANRFGVQGIPAVKAFRAGRMVAEFVGAQPEHVVRDFLAGLADTPPGRKDRVREPVGVTGDEVQVRHRVSAHPDDMDARLELAAILADKGQHREALEMLLGVLERDRQGHGQRARRDMLALFELLGDGSELTKEYRPRLAALLF